jgi:hypothetical protein
MIPGAPHKEVTPREKPNRLEASFKSNKCEPKSRRCIKCSWDREIRRALKASLILTRNHFSTQALAQWNQVLALEERGEVEWMLKWVFFPWLVSNEWREKGGFCTNAAKLAATVQKRLTSVLPTWCRYYRGISQKPNSEGLSVVPTPGRYYRAPGKNSPVKAYRKYQPGVGTVDKSWFFRKKEQTCMCWL